MKTIQFARDHDGFVISRVDSEVAIPVLQFDKMTPENNFELTYILEKMPVFEIAGPYYNSLHWTRKIPLVIKNRHREFWGLPQLKEGTE